MSKIDAAREVEFKDAEIQVLRAHLAYFACEIYNSDEAGRGIVAGALAWKDQNGLNLIDTFEGQRWLDTKEKLTEDEARRVIDELRVSARQMVGGATPEEAKLDPDALSSR